MFQIRTVLQPPYTRALLPRGGLNQISTKHDRNTSHVGKWYSSRGEKQSSWLHGLKPSISGTFFSGGMVAAIGAGLATCLLLLFPELRESVLVPVSEAVCVEKTRLRSDDECLHVSGGFRRRRERSLQEAVARSRDLLRRIKDEVGSPGIVVGVSVAGKLVWAEGLGYADAENRQPCTCDSVHRVASISKSFTMTAVAKLWEEGKLDLDKAVQFYVPEFPEKTVDGEKVTITTRQLVSHLAGIRHYSKKYIQDLPLSKTEDVTSRNSSESTEETKDLHKTDDSKIVGDSKWKEFHITKDYASVVDALELFKEDPLMHKPGSKFYYTTHGWTLVSAIVAAAASQNFLTYMRRMFQDLGLYHTVPDEASPLIYHRARGYVYDKGVLVNTKTVNLSHKWAGGGFLSDVRDLVQFGNAMLYSYQYTDKHRDCGYRAGYLKPETLRTIWSPVALTECSWDKDGSYAMGWAVRENEESYGGCPKGNHLVSHTGSAVGFSSVLLVVPDKTETGEIGQDWRIQDGDRISDDDRIDDSDVMPLPHGVVVAIIANVENASLYKTAIQIVDTFQEVNKFSSKNVTD